MPRSSEVVLTALLLAAPAVRGAPAKPTPPAMARLSFVEQRVELSSTRDWHEAKEGTAMRPCPSDHAVGAHPRRSR
jgi:hypothetical protein